MKKLTISFAGPLAIGMLVLQLASPQAAKAQVTPAGSGCTIKSIAGPYGFLLSGWTNATGPTLPVATLGRLAFNGKGDISGTITYVLNGSAAAPEAITGTYTVNPDCTGLATITPTNATSADHLSLVSMNQGALIDLIQTDMGTTVTGTANLQTMPN
ncbi:MAG TPA: hypothetical protein VMR62_30935 [Bryobacteraceae bacterium]|jgi:hypothetical protein|nr:hypothetical protein [Bryobacteraceae bacterium]